MAADNNILNMEFGSYGSSDHEPLSRDDVLSLDNHEYHSEGYFRYMITRIALSGIF